MMSPNFEDEGVRVKNLNEETLTRMFEEIDFDGDGLLQLSNLMHYFNHTASVVSDEDYIEELMSKYERRDREGRVDYDEFKAIFITDTD